MYFFSNFMNGIFIIMRDIDTIGNLNGTLKIRGLCILFPETFLHLLSLSWFYRLPHTSL
jgi:phage FluMu protein gp41